MDDELISRNVVKLAKLPTVRKKKRKRWTSEEARRFLASAREDNDPYYAAYVLVLIEGLRKGEFLGLTEDAVDFDTMTIRIENQLQRVGRQLLHRKTKTPGSDADLPIPTVVGTALRLRFADRKRDKKAAGVTWRESHLLFTTKYGTPVEPRNFDRVWGRSAFAASQFEPGPSEPKSHPGRR